MTELSSNGLICKLWPPTGQSALLVSEPGQLCLLSSSGSSNVGHRLSAQKNIWKIEGSTSEAKE